MRGGDEMVGGFDRKRRVGGGKKVILMGEWV